MHIAIGSLDISHFGNNHGIVVENNIAVVSRGPLPETLDTVLVIVRKCTLVFVQILETALSVIFARILVGIVLIANTILVFGTFLLTLGKSNVLVLVEVTLATVDTARSVVSANIFLAVDGEGIQIIVIIFFIRRDLDALALGSLKSASILELIVGKVADKDVVF